MHAVAVLEFELSVLCRNESIVFDIECFTQFNLFLYVSFSETYVHGFYHGVGYFTTFNAIGHSHQLVI